MARSKKRADGLYQRSFTIGRKPDGSPIRKTLYAKSKTELDAKSLEFQINSKRGTLSNDEKITFKQWAEKWQELYKTDVESNTGKMYKTLLEKHINPVIGNIKLRDLKPHHIQSLLNDMASTDGKQYAKQTLRKVKSTINQVLCRAMENGLIFKNVSQSVLIPDASKTARNPISPDDIKLITASWQGHRMGLAAMLMLYCGLRRGEVVALTWNDVDLKKGVIHINKSVSFDGNRPQQKSTKTESGVRDVTIPSLLKEPLKLAKTHAECVMVCPSTQNTLMTESAFSRAWESYFHYLHITAGGRNRSRSQPKLQVIQNITPHMLRHTFATMLYDAGVDVLTAQKLLGHKTLEVTMKIYTHLTEQRKTNSIAAYDVYINGEILSKMNAETVKMQ